MEAKHAAAREIALAFGVPPMLLGIPGDNTYSNYREANRVFWRQTVLPLAARFGAALTQWLAPALGESHARDRHRPHRGARPRPRRRLGARHRGAVPHRQREARRGGLRPGRGRGSAGVTRSARGGANCCASSVRERAREKSIMAPMDRLRADGEALHPHSRVDDLRPSPAEREHNNGSARGKNARAHPDFSPSAAISRIWRCSCGPGRDRALSSACANFGREAPLRRFRARALALQQTFRRLRGIRDGHLHNVHALDPRRDRVAPRPPDACFANSSTISTASQEPRAGGARGARQDAKRAAASGRK